MWGNNGLNGRGYAKALGERLRDIRLQKGMSLQDVQEASRGRWKAAVIGAYERGDRNVSVARLSQLADFYGVPVPTILPENAVRPQGRAASDGNIVLDLEELQRVPSPEREPLERFATMIQLRRGDYNGRLLSIRRNDLDFLGVLCELNTEDLAVRLREWGLLVRSPEPPRLSRRG
jgi:transcriptional regulator with XRE-family HTH domain